jgi:hypothetical protein
MLKYVDTLTKTSEHCVMIGYGFDLHAVSQSNIRTSNVFIEVQQVRALWCVYVPALLPLTS